MEAFGFNGEVATSDVAPLVADAGAAATGFRSPTSATCEPGTTTSATNSTFCVTAYIVVMILRPCGLLRGRDVLLQVEQLKSELSDAFAERWAPNCATFNRAREIPIPGVARFPTPLRSEEFPEGIPNLKVTSPRNFSRVLADTKMADIAAVNCRAKILIGGIASLEHTGRSIALHLASWKQLIDTPCVIVTHYHTCMFEGSNRRKLF